MFLWKQLQESEKAEQVHICSMRDTDPPDLNGSSLKKKKKAVNLTRYKSGHRLSRICAISTLKFIEHSTLNYLIFSIFVSARVNQTVFSSTLFLWVFRSFCGLSSYCCLISQGVHANYIHLFITIKADDADKKHLEAGVWNSKYYEYEVFINTGLLTCVILVLKK